MLATAVIMLGLGLQLQLNGYMRENPWKVAVGAVLTVIAAILALITTL